MSKVRISVEWVFGGIANYFKFIDLKNPWKLVCVICAQLKHALSCLYGNTTSTYFQLVPPNLNEYLQYEQMDTAEVRNVFFGHWDADQHKNTNL
jgi:hypothetical protein